MLRAVFFDVGNTLIYPHPSVSVVCREILAQEGHVHDLSAIESLMPLVDEYYEDRYRTDDTFWTDEGETSQVWVGMYSLMCRRLGIEDEAEHIARRVYDAFGSAERWRAYDDVSRTLVRLRERGLKLGVISNWDRRLESLLEGMGFAASFDTTVSSADVGLHKPDPRIFELACKRLGVAPEEAAHVGDHHYADVLGASAAGLMAVLIDRHGGPEVQDAVFLRTLDDIEVALRLEGNR